MLRPDIGGTPEQLDTILVNSFKAGNDMSAASFIEAKYYYTTPKAIELAEGNDYEIIREQDTFKVTNIEYEAARQEYILCGDHCTVAPVSVKVNGIAKKPEISDRDIFSFQIN